MADILTAYGTQGQTITCTLASLATASARESASIDNRTTKYQDALVFVQIKLQNTAVGTDPYVYLYVAATVDDGTTWPDAVTGADAAITMDTVPNLAYLGRVWVAQNLTKKAGPFSVAGAFDGSMPAMWSLVVRNNSGVTLSATESDHKKLYQGIYSTVA